MTTKQIKEQIKLSETICELQSRIDTLSDMLDGATNVAPELVVPINERLNMASYEVDCLYRQLNALDGPKDKLPVDSVGNHLPTDREIEIELASTDDLSKQSNEENLRCLDCGKPGTFGVRCPACLAEYAKNYPL